MEKLPRREFLRKSAGALGAATAISALPASIRRALAIPANVQTGTIQDVKHVVILVQENRAFDHYFGTLKGVRGFGDPFPINLPSGKPVWFQSNGTKDVPPFHFDSATTAALLVGDCPHSYPDTQAAWNQGAMGQWPLYKGDLSMGYYRRTDIPFQYALAEAFTICDNYHAAITGGTDPNRITIWSGSNYNPTLGAAGTKCTVNDAEVNNGRCAIVSVNSKAPLPGWVWNTTPGSPGYPGPAFTWPTLPEILQSAGITWHVYQTLDDNGGGIYNGTLAFKNFRDATSATGGPLYEHGMTAVNTNIEDFSAAVLSGALPQVSWIVPEASQCDHPAQSNPADSAHFVSQVLDALTANPAVWSQTALFITYDENDGFFDHLPAPAVPSYNKAGTALVGASTVAIEGEYFDTQNSGLDSRDTISYRRYRPYGMGPRVPMLVISPWSRGGWVNSQVFDHTSLGMFLEKRFGIKNPNVSAWHRAVSGDLTTAFDFTNANVRVPQLPSTSNYQNIVAQQEALEKAGEVPEPPSPAQALYQEPGIKYSRALPYVLSVDAAVTGTGVTLSFINSGTQGVVFHVYDQLNLGPQPLGNIPRRYTVGAGKSLTDVWSTAANGGAYSLYVYGPNGFVRFFDGNTSAVSGGSFKPEIAVDYEAASSSLSVQISNAGPAAKKVTITANKYFSGAPASYTVPGNGAIEVSLNLARSFNWYDFTVAGENPADFQRRFAGRLETGADGITDPAMAANL